MSLSPERRAALEAFCASTAAGCLTEALRCDVESEVNRRDGAPLIASMYARIAESARERAAKFTDLVALLRAESSQAQPLAAIDHATDGEP